MNKFCDDDLLDLNRTWNTEKPRLTKCLANVGFTIVPSLIFLVIILFEFNDIYKSKNKLIKLNKFNIGRFLICSFAILSNLSLLFNYGHEILFTSSSVFTISDLFATFIRLLFFVSFFLHYFFYKI